MDADVKCNNLSCRKTLMDKAVVWNVQMSYSPQLSSAQPARPTCLSHHPRNSRDDVVVSSLHPSNDYKTSVLSGLGPSLILEICGRAMSFWQYQTHQENSFQQAVLKNLNERNAQLQKQLDNVIREANGEINLMANKVAGLEKELELERRKLREMQDSARERDKEYQKLKNHYEKIKRKTLLAPHSLTNDGFAVPLPSNNENQMMTDKHINKQRGNAFANPGGVNIGAVVGGMEANGIQRTPIRGGHHIPDWQPMSRHDAPTGMNPLLGASGSERSASADEVENILGSSRQINRQYMRPSNNVAQYAGRMVAQPGPALQSNARRAKAFRPAVMR
ncbi:hypothetical protein DFH11DRAFT_1540541 [Phellopilus nigrolimitatus]|nr:hypothetical protein DFH11DRAFT_1540541 [Phellopilus nigrolimitatus]